MADCEMTQPLLSRRRLLRAGAWAGAGAALSGLPLGRLAWAQTAPAPGWPNVTAMIDSYVGQTRVANMVAGLGWGQKQATFLSRGALAIGGAARADADSLYRIYSMTKPVTGMAAMMLIDDGKLGLDQPIAEILPAFAKMQVQKTYDGTLTDLVPAARPITVRNLLTHTAGLGYAIMQKGPISAAYARAGLGAGQISRLPIPGLSDYPSIQGLAAFADKLATLPLVAQPGSRWSYSVGLDLLGRVIEVASGEPFDAFLKSRIFDPAGMTSTFFTVPRSEVARFTTNYGILNGTALPIDPAGASVYLDPPPLAFGGSGLVSSARDYDRFLRMLLGYGKIDGKRVMGELAVRVGTSNLLPEGASTKGTFVEGQGFGAGGRVSDGVYGWGGAAGTVAFVSYKAGLRATLMTQYMPSEAWPVHGDFPKAVLADLAAMKAAAAPAAAK